MLDKFASGCHKDAECKSGWCYFGTCNPGNEGAPCNGEGTCMSSFYCGPQTQRCIPKGTKDHVDFLAPCKSKIDCKKDQYCSKDTSAEKNMCLYREAAGSTCNTDYYQYDDFYGEQCADGFICYGGRCTEQCYPKYPKMCQDGYLCKPIEYNSGRGACIRKTPIEQPHQGFGYQEKPLEPSGQEQSSSSFQEGVPHEPQKVELEPVKEGGGKKEPSKPAETKPKKKVKLPKKKPEDETEEESEEEEAAPPAPTAAPGAGMPAIPSDQHSLFKSLGLPENNRQVVFYAVSICVLLLLLVLLIVFIVACVRRSKKKRAEKKKDLETSAAAAGPETGLPSYEELQQSAPSHLPGFAATEKGSLEKKHE